MKKEISIDSTPTTVDTVGHIAIEYGFSVCHPIVPTTLDIQKSKTIKETVRPHDLPARIATTHFFSTHLYNNPGPALLMYRQESPKKELAYVYELIGSNRTTSEALLIKTMWSTLQDIGYKHLYMCLNSIGDKESIAKYDRELNSYFKKNAHILQAKNKDILKKDMSMVFSITGKDADEYRANIPHAISSLSDQSRVHLKEVIEYLEAFDIPYRINPYIVSPKSFASHTVFEIRNLQQKNDEEGVLVGYGYRYNYLAKKIGLKKDIPSVCGVLMPKKVPAKKIGVKNIKKPEYYVVQLGNTAKLKTLNVVEILRQAGIPVYHSITKDKITGQLSGAEYMHASHVLIIGQKEALENSVVVRNVISREQETVPVTELASFLKKLKNTKKK